MNRIIKFRGRDAETGEHIICGFGYAELHGKKYIFDAKFGMAYHVAPDSVAQLIAIDKNGNEVFEGDKVIRVDGEDYNPGKTFPMLATFEDFAAINNGEIVLEVAV